MKRIERFFYEYFAIVVLFGCLFTPAVSAQDDREDLSNDRAMEILKNLERDIGIIQPALYRKIQLGQTWLETYETIRSNLAQNKAASVVDWILFWNDLERTGPATLSTREALALRSDVGLHARQRDKLRSDMERIEPLARELVLELEALDRIERYRRRDLMIRVLDANGKPIPGANVSIQQTNHAFLFGCNIFGWRAEDTPRNNLYRERFAKLFNYATLGFYWAMYEGQEGVTREDYWKQVGQWCEEHNIQTKGHPLAWNTGDPQWLPNDLDRVYQLQMDRVTREVTHFKGMVDWWDAVNEVTKFDRDEFKKKSPKITAMWERYGQFDFPIRVFRTARQANPDAFLSINDYELSSRDENRNPMIYEDVLDKLVDENGKKLYDAIGIQSHMHGNGAWKTGRILEIVDRFSRYGVPLHFTETTIVSGPGKWQDWQETTPELERVQAAEVERFYRTLFSCPEVDALTWWDLSDFRAWQRAPAGLIRADMSPKPAYNRLQSLIHGEWWTSEARQADSEGESRFRGFLGDYSVTVSTADGSRKQLAFQLSQGSAPTTITIEMD